MNELTKILSEFKERRLYVSFFDFTECELLHISEINENIIKLVTCREPTKCLTTGEACDITPSLGIDAKKIDMEVVELIKEGRITSIINWNGRIIYLQDTARPMIAQKCKITGSVLYDNNLLADIILQAGMSKYRPTGKTNINYPIAVIDKYERALVLTGILSKMPEDANTFFAPEERYTLSDVAIDKNGIKAVFDIEECKGFVISMIDIYSDIGKGIGKRIGIRPTGTKIPVPLYEVKGDEREEYLEKVHDLISNKGNTLVTEPITFLRSNKGFDSIGKKRIKQYFSSSDLKVSERDFFIKVLSVPTQIGNVNRSIDIKFLGALGNAFKKSATINNNN